MQGIYRKLEGPTGLAVLDLVDYYDDGYIITRINVPKAHRGKGIGTELLNECLAQADKLGVRLWLEIQPFDGLSYKELEAWYMRHGFKGNMIYRRNPKAS